MRTIKKLIAVMLAAISLFTFCIVGYAEEPKEDTQSDNSYLSFGITLEEGAKANYKDIPYDQNYAEETYLFYLYDGLGNSNERKIVKIEGDEIHALREGHAAVEVRSAETDERLCYISVSVKPREADDLSELFDISFDTVKESISKSFEVTAAAFLSTMFGIFMPFVTLFALIFSV